MADQKISQLTEGTSFQAGDEAVVNRSGTNFKVDPTQFSGFDLTAISTSIADTAVDVFVYDTSRDSDGGAWRHRTQHTSWYNETLNTATRGSRREFPAVAVIVAEAGNANGVYIYDGDDPTLPLWMKLTHGLNNLIWSGGSSAGYSLSCVEMLNGRLSVGIANSLDSGQGGLLTVDFLSEGTVYHRSAGSGITGSAYKGTIEQRNDGLGYIGDNDSLALAGVPVNDVAMTVLPNAPIDAATGLPVPTIAVATDGGVSVINNDGTVADSSETAGMAFVSFNESNRLFYNDDSSDQVYYADTYAADGFSDGHYDTDAAPYTLPGNVTDLALNAFGQADGVTVLAEDPDTQANGMVAYVTSSYNTGFMNGDIKLATLSDTDDTDVTGSELVTNGTFDTDTSGWAAAGSAVLSVSSNALRITTSDGGFASATQSVTTVAGKSYVFQYTRVAKTADRFAVNVGPFATGQISSTGTSSFTFVATSSSTQISLEIGPSGRDAGEYVEYDNISLRLAEPDRSVNGNGLIVYGTITKTYVDEV